jgi:hypothetical protein
MQGPPANATLAAANTAFIAGDISIVIPLVKMLRTLGYKLGVDSATFVGLMTHGHRAGVVASLRNQSVMV